MSLEGFNFDHIDSVDELRDLQRLNSFFDNIGASTSASTSRIESPLTSFCTEESECSKIDRALSLNKLADEKLHRLEKLLTLKLNECNQKLKGIETSYRRNIYFDKHESFRYASCGKPYFKDKANFTPHHNKDTITMLNNGMYNFSTISPVPGWTVRDKSRFINLLLKISQDIHKKQIDAKITKLNQEKKELKLPSTIHDPVIKKLKQEISGIRKLKLREVAIPINEEYDWEDIARQLNHRHTAQEYQCLWKLFLHPTINKNSWTKSEHTSLQKIAFANNFQEWEDIANKLGTKRTGYQCFVYFRTNMNNTFTGQKWTKEEEEYLKRLIDYYREGKYIPWGKVATSMENRTKIQIYNKYYRLCEERKGRFLAEEDAVILTCVDQFGVDFKRMANYLPGRSVSQLRIRYQILAKQRISTVWTVEEDNKLIKLLANKEAPTIYSNISKYFPGKDRMNIRSRYLTLVKWMKLHPNSDLSRAPRRAARRLGHGHALDNNLHKAIENLKKRIQFEVDDRKCKKVTVNSPENVIEDAIMATLITHITRHEEAKKMQESQNEILGFIDDANISFQNLNVTNLRKLLILLKCKLDKKQLINSKFNETYPDLIEGEKDVSLVRMKSYSKKQSSRMILKDEPDIFGRRRLQNLEYVLPPNYATITGCRQLIAWVSENKKNKLCDINLNVIMRRNNLLKEHFFLLVERFSSLFLWPMLLSNEAPRLNNAQQENGANTSEATFNISDPGDMIGITDPEKRPAVAHDDMEVEQ